MSDQGNTCRRCDTAMPHDVGLICSTCGGKLRRTLTDTARLAGEHEKTIARLDDVVRRGASDVEHEWWRQPGALFPTPMPYSPDASARYHAARNELVTTARHIAETRGLELPQVPRRAPDVAVPVLIRCQHRSCASVRRGRLQGPSCADITLGPQAGELATVCAWLTTHTEWLRHQPDADETWPALIDACKELERIIDTAAGEVIVGRCPCEQWLYAQERAETVRCRGCGTRYDVASSRADLRENLDDRIMTGAEIARLAGYLGIADTKKARLMVKVWAQRGKLERHRRFVAGMREVEIETVYRFGDALPLLQVAYAKAA